MTDKQKIIGIYAGVAILCLLIIGMGIFLSSLKKNTSRPVAEGVGKEKVGEILTLERDLEVTTQTGQQMKFSDLDGKTWIAAQFYAACPMCAKRNTSALMEAYRKFQDHPDFRVVCMSVDPEADTPEHLGAIQEQLETDPKNWLFVKTEKDLMWDYMRNVMFFTDIRERTEPLEIAQKGKWSHDLGLQIYRGTTMIGRWHEGLPKEYLFDTIAAGLQQETELSDETRGLEPPLPAVVQ